MQVAAGALLDINGGYQPVGSLSGGGTLANNNSVLAATLAVGGDNTSQTFSGVLATAVPANLALVKVGSGTQVLSGSSNYAGGTTVSGGVLRMANPWALGPAGGSLTTAGGTLDPEQQQPDRQLVGRRFRRDYEQFRDGRRIDGKSGFRHRHVRRQFGRVPACGWRRHARLH